MLISMFLSFCKKISIVKLVVLIMVMSFVILIRVMVIRCSFISWDICFLVI